MGNAIPEYVKVRSFIYSLAVNRTDPMQKMPSEKELCSMFQVSRVTVRNALEPLVSSGVLICKRGMGTFVNPAFQTNRERNSYTLGYIRYGGMQSTGQLTGSAADAIELCGMEGSLLFEEDSLKVCDVPGLNLCRETCTEEKSAGHRDPAAASDGAGLPSTRDWAQKGIVMRV